MNPAPKSSRLSFLLLTVSLPLFLLDQATKVLTRLHIVEPIEIIPGFFQLVFVSNTGAAFGLGKNNNLFFVGLSIVALIAIILLGRNGAFRNKWQRWGLVLLLPGLAGNLLDRLLHGYVVDFLDFQAGRGGPHWPAFNVADTCICLAVACFLWGILSEAKNPAPARPPG
jgi:signal peptidase II